MVMNFKGYLEKDLNTVFLNNKEFAEEVNINGHSLTVLIEEDKSKKFNKKSGYDYGYENHSETNKLIALKESDYIMLGSPERDERITIDNDSYLVLDIELDDGLINLKVQVYR